MAFVLALMLRAETSAIECAADAHRLFSPGFAGAVMERAQIAFLDGNRRVMALGRIDGHVCDAVALPVRPILAHALGIDAAGLLVAHNHPGGDPSPSAADIAATGALARGAATLGIRLVDHLVYAADDCRSFRRLGLL